MYCYLMAHAWWLFHCPGIAGLHVVSWRINLDNGHATIVYIQYKMHYRFQQ